MINNITVAIPYNELLIVTRIEFMPIEYTNIQIVPKKLINIIKYENELL